MQVLYRIDCQYIHMYIIVMQADEHNFDSCIFAWNSYKSEYWNKNGFQTGKDL